MIYTDLIGKKLLGVMKLDDSVILFLRGEAVELVSDCEDCEYSWYSNWRINSVMVENQWPERTSEYKAIGETILSVESNDYDTATENIKADMGKWVAAVGEGDFGAKEGENYELFRIKTNSKTITFGTVYWDCHYPTTVWNVL